MAEHLTQPNDGGRVESTAERVKERERSTHHRENKSETKAMIEQRVAGHQSTNG